jgi:thioredoxin-related protein
MQFSRVHPLLLLLTAGFFLNNQTSLSAQSAGTTGTLKWYTWEEAAELNKVKPKKIFVDVYTEWCGWCKRMDKATFADPAVSSYIAENFYPVKFDAEQKADVNFNGELFKFVEEGRRGVHTLAYALLDGRMGYPSFVYLNEKYERIMISPGYKEPVDIMKELKFAAGEHYQSTSWEEYRSAN